MVATIATIRVSLDTVGLRADDGVPVHAMESKCTVGMLAASHYMRTNVSVKGGYVYKVTLDLKQRWGEGIATPTEIWVQPPGTPAVGMAFLQAYNATGQTAFLDAATECAYALLFGQLESGCWTDRIDFDPKGKLLKTWSRFKLALPSNTV